MSVFILREKVKLIQRGVVQKFDTDFEETDSFMLIKVLLKIQDRTFYL